MSPANRLLLLGTGLTREVGGAPPPTILDDAIVDLNAQEFAGNPDGTPLSGTWGGHTIVTNGAYPQFRTNEGQAAGPAVEFNTLNPARIDMDPAVFSGIDGASGAEAFLIVKLKGNAQEATCPWGYSAADFNTHLNFSGQIYDNFFSTLRKATGTPAGAPNAVGATFLYNPRSATGLWASRINGADHFSTASNVFDKGVGADPGAFGFARGLTTSYSLNAYVTRHLVFPRVLTPEERAEVEVLLGW